MSEAVEGRGRHLGVTEDGGPLLKLRLVVITMLVRP